MVLRGLVSRSSRLRGNSWAGLRDLRRFLSLSSYLSLPPSPVLPPRSFSRSTISRSFLRLRRRLSSSESYEDDRDRRGRRSSFSHRDDLEESIPYTQSACPTVDVLFAEVAGLLAARRLRFDFEERRCSPMEFYCRPRFKRLEALRLRPLLTLNISKPSSLSNTNTNTASMLYTSYCSWDRLHCSSAKSGDHALPSEMDALNLLGFHKQLCGFTVSWYRVHSRFEIWEIPHRR